MASRIDDYSHAICHSDPTNTCDIGGGLLPRADSHRIGLSCHANVADINIVTARGEVGAGLIPQRNIERADCIAVERLNTGGRIVDAGSVLCERFKTTSRVVEAGCVAKQRRRTVDRITAARCITLQRIKTEQPEGTECCGGYRLVVAMAKYRISLSLRPGSTFFAVAMRGKRRWPARREYATDFPDSSGARRSRPQPSPAALPFLHSLRANCSTRSGRILRQDGLSNQER